MNPDFFNLYSEFILKELEEVEEGIQVNGKSINSIRYADDTVLLASSEAGVADWRWRHMKINGYR